MKKKGKIIISLMVLLVLVSNISYAVTVSLCGMSKSSSCCCSMPASDTKDESIRKEPCCKEEINNINNSSDFDTQSKIELKSSSLFTFNPGIYCYQNQLSINNIPLRFIFYESPPDLPIKYSSLLI